MTGSCEFALTESLFDHDFPGHYRRQSVTVAVSFDDADGPLRSTRSSPNSTTRRCSRPTRRR